MLIDAFLFFNEKELVELRIKYLEKIVDFFVVIEANITHQEKQKSWNFPSILERIVLYPFINMSLIYYISFKWNKFKIFISFNKFATNDPFVACYSYANLMTRH